MKPLILICGPSGSGKTTLVNQLKADFHIEECRSITTRAPRVSDLPGAYQYVSVPEFQSIDMLEWTVYNGNYYGTARDDIDTADISIVEPNGVESLRTYCRSKNRRCLVIGLTCDVDTLNERMLQRGDSQAYAITRIRNDMETFRNLDAISDVLIRNFDMFKDYDTVCAVVKSVYAWTGTSTSC